MLRRPYRVRRARVLSAALVLSLFLNAFWFCRGPGGARTTRGGVGGGGGVALSLPPEYPAGAEDADESAFCRDRFGPKFLHDIRGHALAYCAPGSPSAVTCFHTRNHPDGRVDSLCIGQNATLNPDTRRFQLGCHVRALRDNETAAGLVGLGGLASYWYGTGPGVIFRNYVDLATTTPPDAAGAAPADHAVAGVGEPAAPPPRYALLLQREGETNLWHCLMEIMTMTLTFDVLRSARPAAPAAGPPFFAVPDSVPDTQVVILDDKPDGPYFDLWRLFAGRPPVRLRAVLGDPATARAWAAAPLNLVVPLAGAANPLWQNDWTERDCRAAPLLRVFAQRVLAHYGVTGTDAATASSSSSSSSSTAAEDGALALPEGDERERTPAPAEPRPLRLTLIDRAATRRLAGGAALLRAVRRRFPDDVATAEAVDFAALNFTGQLRAARATDVLVGVHGAGLTHALFMRPGAGAVVELEPPTLDYKGFRNLARMRGLHHFYLRGAAAAADDDDLADAPAAVGAIAAASAATLPGAGGHGDSENDDNDGPRPKTLPALRRQRGGGGGGGGGGLAPPRDWHNEDLRVDEQAFLGVIGEAVAALRRGLPDL